MKLCIIIMSVFKEKIKHSYVHSPLNTTMTLYFNAIQLFPIPSHSWLDMHRFIVHQSKDRSHHVISQKWIKTKIWWIPLSRRCLIEPEFDRVHCGVNCFGACPIVVTVSFTGMDSIISIAVRRHASQSKPLDTQSESACKGYNIVCNGEHPFQRRT